MFGACLTRLPDPLKVVQFNTAPVLKGSSAPGPLVMSNQLLEDSPGKFRFLSICGFPGWHPPTCAGRVHQKYQTGE